MPVGDLPRHAAGVLDVEGPTVEVADHVVGGHQHGRVRRSADAFAVVAEVVGDPQERAVATQRVVGMADGGSAFGGDELEVGDQAHVVPLAVDIPGPGRRVGTDPVDVEVTGQDPALVQPRLGEVHRSDPPAAPGEPDRVAALAGRQVERAAGREVAQLGLHELVGSLDHTSSLAR